MSKGYAMSNLALLLLEEICTNIKMKCLNCQAQVQVQVPGQVQVRSERSKD